MRECLYEQCSFHSALTMPSSVNVGVAAEHRDEPLVLVVGESVLRDERRRDDGIAGAGKHVAMRQAATRGEHRLEDAEPVGWSRAADRPRARGAASCRARCRRSLTMPAIAFIEPFGLPSSLARPASAHVAEHDLPSPSSPSSVSASAV